MVTLGKIVSRVLSYRTQRYVVIRHKWLGLMMWLGATGIFIYILYYVMFYKQSFRKPLVMGGVADLRLCEGCQGAMRPSNAYLRSYCWDQSVTQGRVRQWLANFSCTETDSDSDSHTPDDNTAGGEGPKPPENEPTARVADPAPGMLPCLYQPSDLQTVRFPPESVFIGTHRRVVQHWYESGCAPFDATCRRRSCELARFNLPFASYWPMGMIHNIQAAQSFSFNWTHTQLSGELEFSGDAAKLWNSTAAYGTPPEFFTLGDLLRLADDPADGSEYAEQDDLGHWVLTPAARRHGGIVSVTVTYRNNQPHRLWDDDEPTYSVKVHVLARDFRYDHPPDDLYGDTDRISIYQDTGWMVTIQQDFEMGSFDFVTFLVHVASSLPLLTALFVSIDLISEFVLPYRKAYTKLRLTISPDFHGLVDSGQMKPAICCTKGLTPEVDPLARRVQEIEQRLGIAQPDSDLGESRRVPGGFDADGRPTEPTAEQC
eukprot:TRINITY_DN5156_c0_g1_i2.p1 TRINITY_DN5156_c0_g1~~TRINITY_DN5156_c0_g1_i2.p1  ORF type:complete len:518 (+),score=130.27 TRINITY_DN5156_c0_g1_i2:97-1554(+)